MRLALFTYSEVVEKWSMSAFFDTWMVWYGWLVLNKKTSWFGQQCQLKVKQLLLFVVSGYWRV